MQLWLQPVWGSPEAWPEGKVSRRLFERLREPSPSGVSLPPLRSLPRVYPSGRGRRGDRVRFQARPEPRTRRRPRHHVASARRTPNVLPGLGHPGFSGARVSLRIRRFASPSCRGLGRSAEAQVRLRRCLRARCNSNLEVRGGCTYSVGWAFDSPTETSESVFEPLEEPVSQAAPPST